MLFSKRMHALLLSQSFSRFFKIYTIIATRMDTYKIDIVVTWVDGDDPVWLAEKNKYSKLEQNIAAGDANAICRYRDYGILHYWFRAVERFAPWVNKVFFVTCGQKPDWLNEANPKLRLVNHQDYIPAEYLPTFQSNTIELNLHRIPDLAEHFILFNDDMFLLHVLDPNTYFRNGLPVLPCDLSIPRWLNYGTASRVVLNNSGLVMSEPYITRLVWKNALKFFNIFALGPQRAIKNLLSFAINRTTITGTFGHLPLPHLKSTLAQMWSKYPRAMDITSRHKFRHDDCVNQWLLCTWNMMTGHFHPINEKRIGKLLGLDINNIDSICKIIKNGTQPQVCININVPDGRDDFFDKCVTELSNAFDTILPEKSSFEK